MAKFRKIQNNGCAFHCPGCDMIHIVDSRWEFNGDLDNPTISPSLLVRYPTSGRVDICHSFILDGKIQFLSDCSHGMKGKTEEIPDFETLYPDWNT